MQAFVSYAAERARVEFDPQNLADTILKLVRQVSALTAELAELRGYKAKAEQLERKLNQLMAYTRRLEESYRQLQIGLRRHAADRPKVPEAQMDLGFHFTEIQTPDEIQPEPERSEPSASPPTDNPSAGQSGSNESNRPARKTTPHGRRNLSASELPHIVTETVPPEVMMEGKENFDLVGFEKTSTIVYRRGGHVVFVELRGKYVPLDKAKPNSAKTVARPGANEDNATFVEQQHVLTVPADPETKRNPFPCGAIVRYFPPTIQESPEQEQPSSSILIAPLAERPIAKGQADPSLLAHLVVGKMDYHLPYYRQEQQMKQLGFDISRSNMVRWHFEVGGIAARIASAMWNEAMTRSWFGMDATGTAIFDKDKYRLGHVFVLVAPGDSVVFQYAPEYDSTTVQKLFGGYKGVIVADASHNHNCLFGPGAATEAGCWAHCRRYVVKAHRAGYRTHADQALLLIKQLFEIENSIALLDPKERLRIRQERSAPIVEHFFEWVDNNTDKVGSHTALGRVFTYATNQREALHAFLRNGEIPLSNNACERALRQVVKGRRAWLFMQSDEHATRSCAIYSLVASCHLHGLDPEFYFQEVLTVAPSWPLSRVLELSPKYWVRTRAQLIADGRLKYIDIGAVLGSKLGLRH